MLRLPGTCRGWLASQVGLGTGAAVSVGLGAGKCLSCLGRLKKRGPGTRCPVCSTCQWADLRATPLLSRAQVAKVLQVSSCFWAKVGDCVG